MTQRPALINGIGGQSVFELGVHADVLTGLDIENMDRPESSGNRSMERQPSQRKVELLTFHGDMNST